MKLCVVVFAGLIGLCLSVPAEPENDNDVLGMENEQI